MPVYLVISSELSLYALLQHGTGWLCVWKRDGGHLSYLYYTRYMIMQLSSGCVYLFQPCICTYVSGSVYVVTRHTAVHPSPKSILWVSVWEQGCTAGVTDAKTTCGGTIQKDSRVVVIVKRTVAFVHSSKAGRFALNWVTGECIHIWNSKKEHALCYACTLWFMCS